MVQGTWYISELKELYADTEIEYKPRLTIH